MVAPARPLPSNSSDMGPVSPLRVCSLPLVMWARDEARRRSKNSAPTAYGTSKCGIARSRQPSGAHTSAVRVPPPSATGGRARRRRPSNITADAGRVMSFTAPAAVRVRGNRPCHRLTFSSRGGRPTTGSGNSISARAVRFGRCVTDRLLPRACPVC